MEFKEVLNNRYGIKEKCIADNGLCNSVDGILSLAELKSLIGENDKVMLLSDDVKIYTILRQGLYEVISKDKVIDVLSGSKYFDEGIDADIPSCEPRLATMEMVTREIIRNNVDGDIAEVGVWKGDFVREVARCLPNRKVYLFDTFDGFDSRDIRQEDGYIESFIAQTGGFTDTSAEMACKNVGMYNDIIVRKGYFPETAKGLENEKFAFVSLDTDLYKPILAGLDFFWPRMVPGGYIFVHDYLWGGVGDAVREFSKREHVGFVPIADACHSVIFAK